MGVQLFKYFMSYYNHILQVELSKTLPSTPSSQASTRRRSSTLLFTTPTATPKSATPTASPKSATSTRSSQIIPASESESTDRGSGVSESSEQKYHTSCL